jgi:hypothetical protein
MKLSFVQAEAHAVGAGGLAASGGHVPALLRQGGGPQEDGHAGEDRTPHHGGHVPGRQGALGRAQQVHGQGKLINPTGNQRYLVDDLRGVIGTAEFLCLSNLLANTKP